VPPFFPPPVRASVQSGVDARGDEAGTFPALARPPVPPSLLPPVRATTKGGDNTRGDDAGAVIA